MSERVLYVDDEPNILAGYQRMLRKEFEIVTAVGGAAGLEAIDRDGPFAVIVADMRMPGMDGVEFLRRAKQAAPDSVRMMLTGNADQQTAIDAVNEGDIFRFLNKPCQKDVLSASLSAGIAQYRLVRAERELLEETLNGSITVLADVLSLANPAAFGRTARIRKHIEHLAAGMGLPDAWQFEVAAMLSQIGCVTLSGEVVEKQWAGQELTEAEEKEFASHPGLGGKLIAHIPRLGNVAHMIARQHEPYSWSPSSQAPQDQDPVEIGGHLLKAVLDFDRLVSRGVDPDEAIATLAAAPEEYDPAIVVALASLDVRPSGSEIRILRVDQLAVGMILDQDVRARNGNLLVTRGQEVTFPMRTRLLRWAQGVGIEEPIRTVVLRFSDVAAEEPAALPAAGVPAG